MGIVKYSLIVVLYLLSSVSLLFGQTMDLINDNPSAQEEYHSLSEKHKNIPDISSLLLLNYEKLIGAIIRVEQSVIDDSSKTEIVQFIDGSIDSIVYEPHSNIAKVTIIPSSTIRAIHLWKYKNMKWQPHNPDPKILIPKNNLYKY